MILTLTDEERNTLRQILKSYLGDLRVEIRRTDNSQFKEPLKHEREVVLRLIKHLDSD